MIIPIKTSNDADNYGDTDNNCGHSIRIMIITNYGEKHEN